MSTIEKLSIRGVRSFGVEGEDVQSIAFKPPLTLILGANGCGKTTVIECLKYALTGDLPPGGTNRGQSFVHDPKIFGHSECMGQVKLQIRTLRGDKICVTRSMKTTSRKAVLKFETLDSTVDIVVDGRNQSISKRCIDVNTEMPRWMGVSKAIIGNVLFCHQEESSWPLDDPKKLKEKFDAIFGTTEYNKAIEKIIKLRKANDSQAKTKEQQLKLLVHLKKEAEDKTMDMQRAQKKMNEYQVDYGKCEEEMEPIRERLIKIQTIEMDVSKLTAKKIELSTKLNKCQDHQQSLSAKIKTPFDGSMQQLDRVIRTFEENMSEKKTNLQQYEIELNHIKAQEKRLQTGLSEMEGKRTTLIYQRQQEQDCHADRARFVRKLAEKLAVPVDGDLETSTEHLTNTLAQVKLAFQCEENSLKEMSANHDQIDHEMQGDIDKLREQKATIESEIGSKRKQTDELKREKTKNQLKIDEVERSAQALKQITGEITKLDQVFEEFKQTVNLTEIRTNIGERKRKRDAFQTQLDNIDEQITFLSSISKTTAELSVKEKQLEQREAEARKVKNKQSDNLRRLLNNEMIDANYKRRIQTIYQNLQRDIGDLNKTINRNQQVIIELDMTRKGQKDELARMERELHESEEKIYEQCHSTPFAEVLERVKENVAKYQLDNGALRSSEVLYKKYIQKMENEPCCPLCHKDMSRGEVGDLTGELNDEIRRLPENIQRTDRILKIELKKYESLLALQPITEKVECLKEDIPRHRQMLKQTEEKLATARADHETYQMSLIEPTSNVELANSMLGDMSLLDEAAKEVQRIREDLENLHRSLPERSSTLTMDEAQIERATISAELKNESKDLDQLQAKYDRESEMMNTMREKRNLLKDKQIKLQEGVQALTQLKTRQQEIVKQCETIVTELQTIEEKLAPLAVALNQAMDAKQRTKNDNRKVLNAGQTKLNDATRIESDVKRCTSELAAFTEMSLEHNIEQLQVQLRKCLDAQKTKANENETTTAKIAQLREDVLGQQSVERDLIDNKELKTLQAEETDLQTLLDDLVSNIGDLDFKSISREKALLQSNQDKITQKRSKLSGQMGEMKAQLEKFEMELNKPDYKNAVRNYRHMFYEYVVLKKISSDLSQYCAALEKTLLKYHTEKMQKINRVIRELWRSIYRGNDIDYIQIKTDEKDHGSDKRRSYDYCVVQSKNEVELDMRGRCSAGQRVLACLIIRIALAETFSSNCGVLALDEPTTNLDRINIVALCEALNKIVEERRTQSNFMLLIITHDEEFITTLGKISSYYRVKRGISGKSIIEKIFV